MRIPTDSYVYSLDLSSELLSGSVICGFCGYYPEVSPLPHPSYRGKHSFADGGHLVGYRDHPPLRCLRRCSHEGEHVVPADVIDPLSVLRIGEKNREICGFNRMQSAHGRIRREPFAVEDTEIMAQAANNQRPGVRANMKLIQKVSNAKGNEGDIQGVHANG